MTLTDEQKHLAAQVRQRKFFSAEETIAGYEANHGKKAGAYLVDLIQILEPYINEVYEAGYAAGLEAAHG